MANIKTSEASRALRDILCERATAAARGNTVISKAEQATLDPVLETAATEVRAAEGRYARVTVDEAVDQASDNAKAVWERFSPASTADGRYLSKAEVEAISAEDPGLGALSRLAYLRAKKPPAADERAAVRAFFDGLDLARLRDSLPGGKRIDPRPGQPGRDTLPENVVAAFDHYARAMTADWATVTVHQAEIDGHAVNVLYMTTDGDDAYLEVFDNDGKELSSAKLLADEIVAWDPFFGRARLSFPLAALDQPRNDDGYSEAPDAAAAGQLPLDGAWTPEAVVGSGRLVTRPGMFIGIADGPAMSAEHTRLAYAAFEYLHAIHLRHVGREVKLGANQAGTLRMGTFTRPDDGKRYLVADWKDVDDGSFTFYFEKTDVGLRLAIKQFNN